MVVLFLYGKEFLKHRSVAFISDILHLEETFIGHRLCDNCNQERLRGKRFGYDYCSVKCRMTSLERRAYDYCS